MSAQNDGGPAFPGFSHTSGYGSTKLRQNAAGETLFEEHNLGMTLRDYFAAHSDVPWNAVCNTMELKYPERAGKFTLDEIAKFRAEMRYREADAMLAARNAKAEGKQ